jgi:hypothetical protein
MLRRTTNANTNRVKRRSTHFPSSNVKGQLSQAQSGLSEEEVDRRAWAAANRIPPNPENFHSDRKKSK